MMVVYPTADEFCDLRGGYHWHGNRPLTPDCQVWMMDGALTMPAPYVLIAQPLVGPIQGVDGLFVNCGHSFDGW